LVESFRVTMNSPEKPLRILAVVYLPWDRRLGAARVWIELTDEWEAQGHTVERFCLTDAFPRPSKWRAMVALRQISFANRAAAYIRKNADRYDVIDALIGTVPFSKDRLGFRGLLVARSVGLYKLYQEFETLAEFRWPDRAKGTLIGRFFYSWAKKRSHSAARKSVRNADLINVPNPDEEASLRSEVNAASRILVQPYGLNADHAMALNQAAQTSDSRLTQKRICFIGMWSIRKGSKDWAKLATLLLAAIPEVKLRFLGTMTDDSLVLADLNLTGRSSIQLISEYQPEDLPAYLSNCTVGLFPSYVEGFGLAILEQLAAGLPVVSYNVPGPRQILEPLGESLLVPAGDVDKLASRAVSILRMDAIAYTSLSQGSASIASKYAWPQIAEDTIRYYRSALSKKHQLSIVFTQPFGLQTNGGGPRILRALLEDAPMPAVSICSFPEAPPATSLVREIHLPARPGFGRLERTRLAGIPQATSRLFARRFARRLEAACRAVNASALHAIAHGGLDFYHAYYVAKKLGRPFFLHIHDDLLYTIRGYQRNKVHSALRTCWNGASARFVIGKELGDEYVRRYGEQSYTVITDGLREVNELQSPGASARRMRIYFMGLFHLEYEENFRTLLAALARIRNDSGVDLSATFRCGGVRPKVIHGHEKYVRILPFGGESDVERDLAEADLLYLPLPFQTAAQPFVRFSLSTKLVTYLGSGIPILYHGPSQSAACYLLKDNDAGALCTTEDVETMTSTLTSLLENKATGSLLARNAGKLARSRFMLKDIRNNFWGTIGRSLDNVTPTLTAEDL
jgi:glycosyltransferase involved in cell wall biosynthesis